MSKTMQERRPNPQRRKFLRYTQVQKSWKRDKRTTISDLISNSFPYYNRENIFPTISDIEGTYVERLENRNVEDLMPENPNITPLDYDFTPILPEEVKNEIDDTDKNTSDGTDKLDLANVKTINNELLSIIFNHWWKEGIPEDEKVCRTILLPKSRDLTKVGNWRQITIGNILVRPYGKIWDACLQTIIKFNETEGIRPCGRVL